MGASEVSCDEIAAFSPAAGSEVGRGVLAVLFVFKDAEAEYVFDLAVEVEEGGANGEEDEDGEEVVEACAQGSEVDEAAEEVVEGC